MLQLTAPSPPALPLQKQVPSSAASRSPATPSGEGLEFMPPSLPPMPVTGLGTYRPLRNVNTSLPLALAVLAEESRVTKPEAHQAQTETEPDSEGGLQGQEAWN